jgi:hypothetical protein
MTYKHPSGKNSYPDQHGEPFCTPKGNQLGTILMTGGKNLFPIMRGKELTHVLVSGVGSIGMGSRYR